MMLKNTDHQKEKRTREVTHDVGKVHLTIMVTNAVNNQDQGHQKGKDTTDVGHDLCKVHLSILARSPERKRYKRSRSRSLHSPFDYHAEKHPKLNKSCSQSPKKSTHDHSWPKISPQVAINSSNKNSSLNRGSSQCTILNSDKHRPELTHHVQLNSTQEKSLFNTASVRGRS